MSRLDAVRRVRELVEHRRSAELAAAEREAAAAIERRAARRAACEQLRGPSGRVTVRDLAAARLAAIAADEAVTAAEQDVTAAEVARDAAARRRTDAAVARRSVERIQERRASEAARLASRRAERQLDDLALTRWGRS